MNLLVTGGAGYVGSHCVRELCNSGSSVVVLDHLLSGHRAAVDPRATLVVGDLADAALLDDLFARHRFDAVIHFAALLDVNASVREPLAYYRNNVIHSFALLERMQANDVKHMVFSSSCATYGVPQALPITEDMPQNPITPYGRSKLMVEWAMQDCARAWGLAATALRYFNAAGAASDGTLGEDHDPEFHLVPVVLQAAMGQRPDVRIFGLDYPTPDGSCVRDYVHVEDLASAHHLALQKQTEGTFRAYNVGTGLGVSVRELVETAREVTGAEITALPAQRRDGDAAELYADPTRIMSELGWEPRYREIRGIVETAWAWHRSHPSGYGDRRV